MKFSVGYQIFENNEFTDEIIKNSSRVSEVYFSWGSWANGRSPMTENSAMTPWEVYKRQESDLKKISSAGIKLNLLFNAVCYGKDSLSRFFYEKIGDTVDYISSVLGLSSVTTASPLIAEFIKNNFRGIDVRASVNMEIGSINGMDYLADYFDGYYLKREKNRNFDEIKRLKAWCSENGKTLHILANSGCLNNCSAHFFHDSLVAHEAEIASSDKCFDFTGVCHEYLKNPEKRVSLVRDTSFIRPEDIPLYEPYFDTVKLATRQSDKSLHILRSYLSGKCTGNILELLEPNHAGRIYPYVIDNQKLSNDWLFCSHNCESCTKCRDLYLGALVNLEDKFN